MSRYKIQNQEGLYFLTLTIVGWIDVFTRKEYRDILIESLKHCQKHKGLVIHAFVIMSNHIHLIARSGKEEILLSNILRDFKSYTGKVIHQTIEEKTTLESRREWMLHLFKFFARGKQRNRIFQFWQSDNHPIELYSPRVINQKLAYVHFNPVEAGLSLIHI